MAKLVLEYKAGDGPEEWKCLFCGQQLAARDHRGGWDMDVRRVMYANYSASMVRLTCRNCGRTNKRRLVGAES